MVQKLSDITGTSLKRYHACEILSTFLASSKIEAADVYLFLFRLFMIVPKSIGSYYEARNEVSAQSAHLGSSWDSRMSIKITRYTHC